MATVTTGGGGSTRPFEGARARSSSVLSSARRALKNVGLLRQRKKLNVAHDDVLDIDRASLLARAHTHTCTVDLPPKVRNSYRKTNSLSDPNLGSGCAIVRSIRTRTNARARRKLRVQEAHACSCQVSEKIKKIKQKIEKNERKSVWTLARP